MLLAIGDACLRLNSSPFHTSIRIEEWVIALHLLVIAVFSHVGVSGNPTGAPANPGPRENTIFIIIIEEFSCRVDLNSGLVPVYTDAYLAPVPLGREISKQRRPNYASNHLILYACLDMSAAEFRGLLWEKSERFLLLLSIALMLLDFRTCL